MASSPQAPGNEPSCRSLKPWPWAGGRRRARAGSGLAVIIIPAVHSPPGDRPDLSRAARLAPGGAEGVARGLRAEDRGAGAGDDVPSRRRPEQQGDGSDRPGSGACARSGARRGLHSGGGLGPPSVKARLPVPDEDREGEAQPQSGDAHEGIAPDRVVAVRDGVEPEDQARQDQAEADHPGESCGRGHRRLLTVGRAIVIGRRRPDPPPSRSRTRREPDPIGAPVPRPGRIARRFVRPRRFAERQVELAFGGLDPPACGHATRCNRQVVKCPPSLVSGTDQPLVGVLAPAGRSRRCGPSSSRTATG